MGFVVSCVACCALAMAMIATSVFAFGQDPKSMPDQQQSQSQAQSSPTSTESQSAEQTFQGTIGRSKDGYVLKDSTGTSYTLDDQKQAKQFNGKSVKVTGVLDASTNMIRVTSIAPAS